MSYLPLWMFLAVCLMLMLGYPVAFSLAGTALIAALPTLVVYVLAGKYFVRGLTAWAVKG